MNNRPADDYITRLSAFASKDHKPDNCILCTKYRAKEE